MSESPTPGTTTGPDAASLGEPLTLPVNHAGDTTLPAQEIMTGRGFVTGKSGSGKSNAATVIFEELLERGLPLAVVDPDGEYRGLAELYPVVHAGATEDCHVTLPDDVDAASEAFALGQRAYQQNLPTVLDLSGFATEDAVQEVVASFAHALFVEAKQARQPYLLGVEEAHEFLPERAKPPAAERLVPVAKRGRKQGLGILAASQRPADIQKRYVTQANWLSVHRLSWGNDTDAVADHLDDKHGSLVPNLDTGESIICADWLNGSERVAWRRMDSPDYGSTPDIASVVGTTPSSLPTDLTEDAEDTEAAANESDDTATDTGSDPRAESTPAPGSDTAADPAPEPSHPSEIPAVAQLAADLREEIQDLQQKQRIMLDFWRQVGPASARDAYAAAGGDPESRHCYDLSLPLKRAQIVEKVGKQEYTWNLPSRVRQNLRYHPDAGPDAYEWVVEQVVELLDGLADASPDPDTVIASREIFKDEDDGDTYPNIQCHGPTSRVLGVEPGDRVHLALADDGRLVLRAGAGGIIDYGVHGSDSRIAAFKLGAGAIRLTGADPGDRLRLLRHPDGVALEHLPGGKGDTAEPVTAPITLDERAPNADKTDSPTADEVFFRATVGRALGVTPGEYVTAYDAGDDGIRLAAGNHDDGIYAYKVQGTDEPNVILGAYVWKALGLTQWDHVRAVIDADGTVRVERLPQADIHAEPACRMGDRDVGTEYRIVEAAVYPNSDLCTFDGCFPDSDHEDLPDGQLVAVTSGGGRDLHRPALGDDGGEDG